MDRFLIPEMVRFTAGSGSVGQTQRKAILLMSRFLMKVRTRCATLLLSHILPPHRVPSISSQLSGDLITDLFMKFRDDVIQMGSQSSMPYEYEYDVNLNMIEADDLALLTRVVEAGRRRQRLFDFSQRFRSQISERMRKMMEANAANVLGSCNADGSQTNVEEKAIESNIDIDVIFKKTVMDLPLLPQSSTHASHTPSAPCGTFLVRKGQLSDCTLRYDTNHSDGTENTTCRGSSLETNHDAGLVSLHVSSHPLPTPDSLLQNHLPQFDLISHNHHEFDVPAQTRREHIKKEVEFLIDNFCVNLKASLF